MKFNLKFNSLKAKIIIPILIIASIGFSVVTVAVYTIASKSMTTGAEQLSSAKSNGVALLLDSRFDIWKAKVEMLSVFTTAKDGNFEEVKRHVAEKKDLYSEFEMVLVADANGNFKATMGLDGNIAERAYFPLVMRGQTVVSEPVISKATGEMITVIATPLKDKSGKITGVVAATVKLKYLANIIGETRIGQTGYAYMINKEGLILSHPKTEKLLKENLSHSDSKGLVEVTKKMMNGSTGVDTYTYEGIEKIAAYAPVKTTGWAVAATVPMSELLAEVNTLRNSAIICGVLSVLAMMVAVFILIARIVKPVNILVEAADKLAMGDLNVNIDTTANDEIGMLSQSVASMVKNINALVADAGMLVEAAVAGRLDTRADATKHSGEYRKIVEGVNTTLDEVIKPVKEAAGVLQEMANGNLQRRVNGDYKGDNAAIKNAMNETLDALSAYVAEISAVLGEMANANLDLEIKNEYKGDFSKIKDALNLIISSFNEAFVEINDAAEQVAAGSRQVAAGSQALSQGSTEQASSIEEITASMNQVAEQTKQNAVNANQANELAMTARDDAAQGNVQMQDMVKAMSDIDESSTNISKIIKVIDEIAFQTNILALNAAVEAARAGQHGKGFAVVAEEVRNLAARSANAAKETTAMIEGSIKKVETGTVIANQTAKALSDIVEGVAKAAVIVGDIAAASNEQASAISQVNQAIAQVSQVVQTNSATAEESAAASEELSSQAEVMKDNVRKFKLKHNSREFRSMDMLSPDVLQAIEAMMDKKRAAYQEEGSRSEKPVRPSGKCKIVLDDYEFGKY